MMVHHRVTQDPALPARLRIAWLREDEWGIGSYRDLLLAILRALSEGDAGLAPRIEALYDDPPPAAEAHAEEMLLAYLAAKRIPVELCPISNVRTGVVPSIADHPARRYFDLGLRLSVNTDDPQMFGNSLGDEYRALETQLGFSRDEIRALILQAVDTSWLPPARKQALQAELTSDPNWNE
jgi:hypothetical protein